MNTRIELSRRRFVIGSAAAGAGLAVGVGAPALSPSAHGDAGEPDEVNLWVVIDPDDTVTIRIVRSEMGQGTLTGLAQLVAEELQCDWSKVTTAQPTPGESLARNRAWGSFATGGSRGIRQSQQYVREGGAAARLLLVEAAAAKWGVPVAECTAENSVITHGPTGRSTSYGAVAAAAAQLAPPLEVPLKDPADWSIAGAPLLRLDTADKLTGKQVFGADLRLPGMQNAAIKACPVDGGRLESFDADKVRAMAGVKAVVRVDDTAVAVVADSWWRAKTALDALPIEWDLGPNAAVAHADILAMVEEGLNADEAFVGNQAGDARAALAASAKTVEAVYGCPFQHHATMEPMNATALWTEDRCEVWCPTQNGESALAATSEAAGLPIEQCDVHKINLGGGFGRRGAGDYITQAVNIARQLPGTPVKLLWSREEDMAHGFYHPITMARLVGGLDEDGNLTGLHVRISGQSILARLIPQALQDGKDLATFQTYLPEGEHAFSYRVPNLLVDHAMRNPHLRPGFWRGVNANQNTIYTECFMDELAEAAGRDALEFRRALLADNPRGLAVLEAVAERGGWGESLPAGVGRGLSVCKAFDSYVAACAEVAVSKDGKLDIRRIVAATDPGYVVNPQQVEAQIEGSFVYGLSAALYGEITVEDGAVEQANFNSYPSLKIAEMPKVETILMPSGGFWGGVGEPTIAVAAPAVLNAIYRASGHRVRQLPLSKVDLSRA